MSEAESLMDYKGVAARLKVSEKTVKRLVARKKLRVVDLGHRLKRFRPVDVARCEERLSGKGDLT